MNNAEIQTRQKKIKKKQRKNVLKKHVKTKTKDENAKKKTQNHDNDKEKQIKELRSLGFTTAHLTPKQGIFRGQTGIVNLSNNPKIINSSVAQVIDFKYQPKGKRTYPRSLLGVIAHIRQTFYDSEWYLKSQEIVQSYPAENRPLASNASLESLGLSRALEKPFAFISSDDNSASRLMNISKEFGLNPWILGSGYEYRQLNQFNQLNPFFIMPIDFPSKPSVAKYMSDLQYTTAELKHWDMAPDNISYLNRSGHNFSITSHRLLLNRGFYWYLISNYLLTYLSSLL